MTFEIKNLSIKAGLTRRGELVIDLSNADGHLTEDATLALAHALLQAVIAGRKMPGYVGTTSHTESFAFTLPTEHDYE